MTKDATSLPTGTEVRTRGVDVHVEIMRYRKLRLTSDRGRGYEFVLIVIPPDGGNFLLQVGNAVPPEALHLVVPGRVLPAKLLERDRRALIIDWEGALSAEASRQPPEPLTVADQPDPEGSAPVS